MIRDSRPLRRLGRDRSKRGNLVHLLAVFTLLVSFASGLAPLPLGPAAENASAHHANIRLPVPSGEQWSVSQGYNTSPAQGGSHYSCDATTLKDLPSQTMSCSQYWQYKYSLDLVATSGATAGRTVVSPVNGVIRWIDESYGGMSIDLGDGYAYAFFHVALASTLRAGQSITQGQYLGTVATAGNGGNGGFPHIHVTLWRTTDGGNWSRMPEPFTGDHAIDGVDLAADTDSQRNQHRGKLLTSSNTASPAADQPPVYPALVSPVHGTTYQVNTHIATLSWRASTGATQYQVVINDGAITSPWISGTSWITGTLGTGQYAWQVRARNSAGQGSLGPKWVFWVDPANPGTTPTPGTTPGTLGMSLSTATGAPGLSTAVNGSGMSNGETVDIYWKTTSGTKLATTTANSAGNWSSNIQIPDAPAGAHKVIAKGKTSGKSAEANFTVTSALLRIPYQGPAGEQIAITVKGFGASETVALSFLQSGSTWVPLGNVTTNASGTGTVTVTMPEATFAWHDYRGVGQASGKTAYGALYVQTSVTLSKTQGSAGTSVTVSAKGFTGSQPINVVWNKSGSSAGTSLCSGTTSSVGSYSCTFTVPQAAAGAYPVVASTDDQTTASASFGIAGAAAVTLTPGNGAVGAPFQLSIGGFQANEKIRLTIDGSSTAWQDVTANASGAVLVKSTIPYLTQGAHTITARGLSSSKTASATLTIKPSMEVTPSGGASGGSATAYVRGMKAGQSISVRFDATSSSNGTRVCSGTTSSDGAYSCSFTVPSVSGGNTYPVLASSSGQTATTSYAVTADGEIGGGSVIGLGTYQVTATQEGLVGGTTSNGHVIVPNDHFVALPACTPANCDWLAGSAGEVHPTYGYIADCGSSCYVRVENPATGICRVEPIWDTGPWFTVDNWWEPTERRNLNNLPTTVNTLAQGYTGVDAAKDGLDVGYGIDANSGVGISNVGYVVGNRAAIDIADGTWKEIGFADGAGPRTVVVSMLWQTGESVDAAREACSGLSTTEDPRIAIDPTSGEVGASVAVTGSDYGAGERVDIFWDSTTSGSPITSVNANGSGSFSTTISIPGDSIGRHLIVGKGATSGEKPSRSFTITPRTSIVIDPLSGPAGEEVAVSGQGFRPGETVNLYWDSTGSTGRDLGSATASSSGEISDTVTVPSDTAGKHLIVGMGDDSGFKASRSFTLAEETAVDAAILIDPTTGPAGTRVTVTGEGFGPGESVDLFWDSTGSTGEDLGNATANSSGDFSATITVPDDSDGKHLIVGLGSDSDGKASRSFTIAAAPVKASVSINSTSGPPGAQVVVTGIGYGAGEQVAIYWDSTGSSGFVLATATATSNGAFSITITIPDASDGKHLIVGLGRTSDSKASRSYTVAAPTQVDPSIIIAPTSGRTATTVAVTGEGFDPGERVDIYWDSTGSSGVVIGSATASSSGTFSTNVSIPHDTGGRHLIVGKGASSGSKASRSFTITQSLSASSTTVEPGDTVRVTLRGYQSGAPISLYWDDANGTPLVTLTGNSTGSAAGSFEVPATVNGQHQLIAIGSATAGETTVTMTVSGGTSAEATASFASSTGLPGEQSTINIANFWSGERVEFYWDDRTSPTSSTQTGFDGSSSVGITVPTMPGGSHTVTVKGVDSGKTATANIAINPLLMLTPPIGADGARIIADVKGWTPGETVTIYFNRPEGSSGGTEACTATGRASGTATCAFIVPEGFAVGTVVPVTATGSAGSSTVTLRITNDPNGFAGANEETPTPEPTATATATATPDSEATPDPSIDGDATPAPDETEPADETPTEEPTEDATEVPTEEPTEEPTDVATEVPADEPAEVATEEPTEVATEAPTEVPTEVVTEAPTLEPTVAPEPRYVTIYAASDASVYSALPDQPQPGDQVGVLTAGGPDGSAAYITFSVEGIGTGVVTSAQLILTGGGAPAAGGLVGVIPGLWVDEASAVYASLPTEGIGAAVDGAGNAVYLPAIGSGEEAWLDVTGVIYGDGVVTFVVTGSPDAIATLLSRESGVAPRLEIIVQD